MRARNATHLACFVGGAVVGARLMYLFDPDRGRSRRAMLRDRVVRGVNVLRRETNKQLQNAANLAVGRMKEVRSSIHDRTVPIDDAILLDRVRAQIGRHVRHMGMLDLFVDDGRVIVKGSVLVGEADKIRKKMGKIRGVRDFELRVEEIGQSEMERRSGQRGFSPERVAI